MSASWDDRVAAVWAAAGSGSIGADETISRVDALAAERPASDPAAAFEAASARDFADREAEAEPLYRRAMSLGLREPRKSRAVIQLASTLRNLGRPTEAIAILQDGFSDAADHPLADAARAFLALCLLDTGDPRSALAVALDALAPHLPEFSRAVRAYAEQLAQE
jgi:tetratricopeptide (TPR) repeat protein